MEEPILLMAVFAICSMVEALITNRKVQALKDDLVELHGAISLQILDIRKDIETLDSKIEWISSQDEGQRD